MHFTVRGRKDDGDYSHITRANASAWRGNDRHSMRPNLSHWEIIVITPDSKRERERDVEGGR